MPHPTSNTWPIMTCLACGIRGTVVGVIAAPRVAYDVFCGECDAHVETVHFVDGRVVRMFDVGDVRIAAGMSVELSK